MNILRYFNKLTIAKKLRLMGIYIAIIGVGISVTSVLIYQYYDEKNLMEKRTEIFSKIVADNISSAILFKDMDNISKTLASLKYQNNITQAYVMDMQWEVLQSYNKKGVTPINEKLLTVLKSKQFLWQDDYLFSIVPVSVDEEILGSLIVVSSLDDYYSRLLKEIWIILFIVTLAIWSTLKFARILSEAIISPILHLHENINNILETQELTTKVKVVSNDEIGALGNNFNQMLDELNDMHQQIIKQKDDAEYKAHHDLLTLLPNRTNFTYRLNQAISQAKRNKKHFSIFFIDLDHFKQINDSMGHDAGDKVLQTFAERIQHCLRIEDTIARMGGDEFTVILANSDSMQSSTVVAEKILKTMEEPLTINGRKLYLTASIGISIYPNDGKDTQTLLKNADAAMYKSKNNGRNKYHFYTEEMTDMAYARIILEAELREALEKEQLLVYYQPQFDILREKLIGMEASVRWNHPQKGILGPDYFLPLAKEIGLMFAIDLLVMKTSMQQTQQWRSQSLKTGSLSLNLSVSHLMEIDFIAQFKELLAQYTYDVKHIRIEITEGEVMKNPEYAIPILQQINDMGISLSINDFGTGYSSLSYLRRLPINMIKIDRSFIKNIPFDEDDVSITKAIIALSNSLNLSIIAEGVENAEQKEFLLKNGCHMMQGYFYGKPMSTEEMENFIRENKHLVCKI